MRHVLLMRYQYLLCWMARTILLNPSCLLMIVILKPVSWMTFHFRHTKDSNDPSLHFQLLNVVFFIAVYIAIQYFTYPISQMNFLMSHLPFYYTKSIWMITRTSRVLPTHVNMVPAMIRARIRSSPLNSHYLRRINACQYPVKSHW